jgi:hypothetical protein
VFKVNVHVQDASAERSTSATESDAHEQRSTANSASHSAGHSAATVDSLVYGVRLDDTGKVLQVLQRVTEALQMGSMTSMLYNATRSAEDAYQAAYRCFPTRFHT